MTLPLFSAATPAPMVARPYQAAAIEAIAREHAARRSTLAVLATGLGKTFVAGQVAKAATGRVLFLAHTDQLVTQAHAALERIVDDTFELEQGQFRANRLGRSHVVASVQSLHEMRLKQWPVDAFSLVIADEAHHYCSKSFSRVLKHFANAKVLGITATPDRGDGKAMGALFESVAFRMDLADAIDEAWSTPLSVATYRSNVDLDGVDFNKSLGDFAAGALDEEIAKASAPVAKAALTLAGDLRTVIFAPGVRSTHAIAGAINEVEPGTAYGIDGTMPKPEARAIVAAFKRGEFRRIVNCMMLTEGFDDEHIQCIIDAAPTTSRARFVQKIGRGTRLWPGIGEIADVDARRAAISLSPKPHVRLIDLAFSSSKHALAGPVDVLGGKYTDAERARAKKILAKDGGGVEAALKMAKEEAARRLLRVAAAAKARVTLEETAAPPRKTSAGELALTPGQERRLKRYGIPYDGNTSKRAATKMIGLEILCEQRGWCNYIQRARLQSWVGVKNAMGMPIATGKALRDAWVANRRLTLSPRQIADIVGRVKA